MGGPYGGRWEGGLSRAKYCQPPSALQWALCTGIHHNEERGSLLD